MFKLNFFPSFQILAYVSQVHKVVLPEGVVDNESLTLDQVCDFSLLFNSYHFLVVYIGELILPRLNLTD